MFKSREEKVVEELMDCLDPKLPFAVFGLHAFGLHVLSFTSMLLCMLYRKYDCYESIMSQNNIFEDYDNQAKPKCILERSAFPS